MSLPRLSLTFWKIPLFDLFNYPVVFHLSSSGLDILGSAGQLTGVDDEPVDYGYSFLLLTKKVPFLLW